MDTIIIVASEEPNPLIPAPYDIIWGTLSFVILLVMFWKYVLPTFNKVTAERAEKIEGGIEQAKVMQAEAARSRDAYSAQLEAATKEAAAIRTAAHGEGGEIVNAAKAEAVDRRSCRRRAGRCADPGRAGRGRRIAAARRR